MFSDDVDKTAVAFGSLTIAMNQTGSFSFPWVIHRLEHSARGVQREKQQRGAVDGRWPD